MDVKYFYACVSLTPLKKTFFFLLFRRINCFEPNRWNASMVDMGTTIHAKHIIICTHKACVTYMHADFGF